jgi:hypothetical protein
MHLPGGPTCQTSLEYSENVVLANSGFHTRNNLSENYPKFGESSSAVLGHCGTNRKVAGSIPDGVIGSFH